MSLKESKQAEKTFETLCEAMKDMKFHFGRNDKELSIEFGIQSKDEPILFKVKLDAEKAFVIMVSPFASGIPEQKKPQAAIAVNVLNQVLAEGNLDFNFERGSIVYRISCCYQGSLIGKEAFIFMVFITHMIHRNYREDFDKFVKDEISLEELMKRILEL